MRGLGLVLLALAANAFPAVAAPVITMNDACDGGLLGTLSENSVSVGFLSCPSDQKVHTEIRSSGGSVVLSLDADQALGTMTIRVAGVELAPSNTEAEMAHMREALDTPEARLVERHLWRELLGAGRNPADRSMAAIRSVLVAYSGLSRPSPTLGDCIGCCGPGCAGCTGCYTTACAAHDICVETYGWGSSVCNSALAAAMISAWCCQGVKLGLLC